MPVAGNPILKSLHTIECRDAVLNEDGTVAVWPKADAIIGNPPFIGGKLMRRALGDATVDRLFAAYAGRVPREADFVCYWFDKARGQIASGAAMRAGLVATNSIRGGANREVLDRIAQQSRISDAWADEPWTLDGAAVRVSLVCFGESGGGPPFLDGRAVQVINTDLTANVTDLTRASRLAQNGGVAFMGDTKGGAFDVPGDLARTWLAMPANPNGRTNADVLRPWVNGLDLTRRPRDMWIIDFGWTMSEAQASFFVAPFAHVVVHVKPERASNNRNAYRENWWRHVEPRQGLFAAMKELDRFVCTPRVAKHRLFVWLPVTTLPDSQVIAIARDDDTSFGILHSRFHEAWALRLGTWLGVGNDPRYTPTTTFETFPFPDGLTPNLPAATYAADPRAIRIAEAARALVAARDRWLNPPEWVEEVPDVLPHLPHRKIPRDDAAAKHLKSRTLTNLYNRRGTGEGAWLDALHADLDRAVAAAYGWPEDIPTDDALAALLALNRVRAA
ncbi:MAG TPA: DNA methyltransferase [Falsiroseomonas sp.]|jgi:type II restriction/modification system DNA methylase subunit YeeA|nr:DNA methyltransferase [Falsiroseomonas sp.]